MNNGPFTCVCCGFRTLSQPPPGTFDICPVCGWEDDNVQADDPNLAGGANELSLKDAQGRWLKSVNAGSLAVEKFGKTYHKDPAWKPE